MKRPKIKKIKKVRVNITLDEDLFIRSGAYIENLSGFFNKCLKNQIEREEQKQFGSDKDMLCYNHNKSPINDKYSLEEIREIMSINWTDTELSNKD